MKEQVLVVQRMQDYIEKNLDEKITLTELARVALFSPWYSYRLFQSYTGYTPSCYIRRLRLARAAKKLKDKKIKILDIAYELGFENVDSFTRAFCREFGMLPSEYSKKPVPITLFVPYGVKFKHLKEKYGKMKNVSSVFIQVTHKSSHKVLIKRGIKASEYFEYCDEVGCDIWGTLLSMDSLCGEPVSLWLPDKYIKPNTSKYVQGVEVELDYNGAIPNGFDAITLPECDYLMFQGEPFLEEDYCEAIQTLQNSINKYDPKIIGYKWNDNMPRIQLEPRSERGYIELRAVERIKD